MYIFVRATTLANIFTRVIFCRTDFTIITTSFVVLLRLLIIDIIIKSKSNYEEMVKCLWRMKFQFYAISEKGGVPAVILSSPMYSSKGRLKGLIGWSIVRIQNSLAALY